MQKTSRYILGLGDPPKQKHQEKKYEAAKNNKLFESFKKQNNALTNKNQNQTLKMKVDTLKEEKENVTKKTFNWIQQAGSSVNVDEELTKEGNKRRKMLEI